MNKYILIAFAVMAFAFYELSGGAEFEPGNNNLVVFAPAPDVTETPAEQPAIVARADSGASEIADIVPTVGTMPAATASLLEGVAFATVSTPDDSVAQSEPLIEAEQEVVVAAAVEPQPRVEEAAPETVRDVRFVDADRVNLRGGPGTDYAVVGKLLRDDMVEVIEDDGNGWLHLRVSATGDEGWMADWLVTAAN